MSNPKTSTTASSELMKKLEENSFLMMSLSGLRSILEKELGLSTVDIATDEMVKMAIQARLKMGEEVSYPYAYIQMSEISGSKDQGTNKLTRRLGRPIGMSGATKSTVRKAYMFPALMSLDFKYVDNDPYRALRFAEAMVLLSQMDAIYFSISIGEEFYFNCRVEIPDSIPIPLSDSQNPQSPSGIEVAVTLIFHTYCGLISDVPSVGSSTPSIGFEVVYKSGGIQEIINGH